MTRALALCHAALAGILVSVAVLYAMGGMPGPTLYLPLAHTLVVGLISLVALVAACATWLAAWRRHDVRAALVSCGFTALAGLLLVHAITTPGGWVFAKDHHQHTVEIAGVMSVPAAAMFILAAMLLPPRMRGSRRWMTAVQTLVLLALGAFAWVGIGNPSLLPIYELMRPPYSWYVLAPTTLLMAAASWRAARTANLTQRLGDAAVYGGVVVLSVAIIIYVTSTPFSLQFWAGHVLELAGFIALGAGVCADVRRPVSAWRLTLPAPTGRQLVSSSEELLGGYVHALTVTLAQVDPDTWAHSRRVAEYAVEVGEELNLGTAAIRRLAVAGLVHDIGKLRIPHDVLHKAGKLSSDEFELIKLHPAWGVDILSHLRGFDDELPLVRGHHEKLSGRGYPDGLEEAEISLETRILTACDVFDALHGARSYKEAWTVERSLGILTEEIGSSFDASVVAALTRVVQRHAPAQAIAQDPHAGSAPGQLAA